jgi:rhamnosyltransferase
VPAPSAAHADPALPDDREAAPWAEGPPVIAVVVTYEPHAAELNALLRALRPQVGKVLVVDNASTRDPSCLIDAGFLAASWCAVLRLPANLGVAAAQNRGIAQARAQGAEFVLLSDQDSEPAPDMVALLLEAARARAAAGIAVAGVGPRYVDARQDNPPPFLRIRGLAVERQPCASPRAVVETDYLISSGCLIPLASLRAIGPMREDLFIDYVDIEWGLRARAAGFRSFGVCAARMQHALGEAPLVLLGRRIPLHSPLRHYYHFRNAVRLYCESGPPLNWKLADGWRLLLKYGVYTCFARPRRAHWWMMTLGIAHGIAGRMGKHGKP